MSISKTAFVKWLETTEGPREVQSDPSTDPLDVDDRKWWRVWCQSKRAIKGLSFHKSVERAEQAAMKYARWLTEFENERSTR